MIVASHLELQQKFAKVVRERRTQAHLSQEDLADLAGLHRTYISQIERGLKSPSLNTLAAIARALGVKISRLLQGIDD